jgi:hypothetical protein
MGSGTRCAPSARLPHRPPHSRWSPVFETLGWPVDHDTEVDENIHFIQVTPPGSACSIAFGRGISEMVPGSLKALQVVVKSADEAHADLTARGIDCSAIDPQPWGRFIYFSDPDGNSWSVQELPDYAAGAQS